MSVYICTFIIYIDTHLYDKNAVDKPVEITFRNTMADQSKEERTYPRPKWIKPNVAAEAELCPDCFKVVGVKTRYNIVCALGKHEEGLTVKDLTKMVGLRQPTVTHHLNTLREVDAITVRERGRERVYALNRTAHCFEECQIPY